MNLSARYQTLLAKLIHENNQQQLAIPVFCKSLYGFLFLKIIFLWPVLVDNNRFLSYELKSVLHAIIYAPVRLAQYDLNLFLIALLILLLAACVLKVNYIISAFIFWFSFSLSRLAFPFSNGSDYVLNLFLFLSIFLSTTPGFRSESLANKQLLISNFVFLICKIQLCLIYLLSGFDKITSTAWRSGDAIYSIVNLEFFINPNLSIPVNEKLFIVLAWVIILFELSFPVLVWFKQMRKYALAAGIIFHLNIIFVLSIPDFGLLMILLYSLFIPLQGNRNYASSLR